MAEIDRKRAEALRKLQAVNRKKSRLRREKGAEINGTQHDVAVSPDSIRKMRTRDLDRFIARANAFTSRGVQFQGGHNGVPIPSDKARRLAALESQVSAKHEEIMGAIGHIRAPFSNMTLRERDAQMRPSVRAGGETVNRAFDPVRTDIRNVTSPDAVDKLIRAREKQLEAGYRTQRIAAARWQADRMLVSVGVDDMRKELNKLSDDQFFTWWEYGPYAGELKSLYEINKAQEEQGVFSHSDARQVDDTFSELRESVEWAKTIDENAVSRRGNAGTPQKRTRRTGKTRR